MENHGWLGPDVAEPSSHRHQNGHELGYGGHPTISSGRFAILSSLGRPFARDPIYLAREVPIRLASDYRSPRKPFREAATDLPPVLRIDIAVQGQVAAQGQADLRHRRRVTAVSKLSKWMTLVPWFPRGCRPSLAALGTKPWRVRRKAEGEEGVSGVVGYSTDCHDAIPAFRSDRVFAVEELSRQGMMTELLSFALIPRVEIEIYRPFFSFSSKNERILTPSAFERCHTVTTVGFRSPFSRPLM